MGLENAGLENDGQHFSKLWTKLRGLENAGLENDGQNFSKREHNYGVWKMQEYKSSRVQLTHTVYIKEAVSDTLQSSTGMSCPLCCTPIDMVMRVYF